MRPPLAIVCAVRLMFCQFIIQSTSPPVNESLMELLLMIRRVAQLAFIDLVSCVVGAARWHGTEQGLSA